MGNAVNIVGGAATLGRQVHRHMDLVEAVRNGLPVGTVEHMVKTGKMTPREIDRVVIPRKTLENRKKLGTLTPEQSDRLMRAARIIAAAEDVFGPDKAKAWLRRPTAPLGGEAPLDMLDTDEGAREVERLLGRIEHGIAA